MAFGIDSKIFRVGDEGWFAGGGGGCGGTDKDGGLGGRGGGGGGGYRAQLAAGDNALPGSGGGGGGGSNYSGAGGSGAVIVRYVVDESDVPYIDTKAATLADFQDGNQRITPSNEVAVVDFPVPDGYDLYQIVDGDERDEPGQNWVGTDQLPSLIAFDRPLADSNLVWTIWFTNSVSEVKPQRGQAEIFYTAAVPFMAVRPLIRRQMAPGGEVVVALSDFRPPKGGVALDDELEVVSCTIALASEKGVDLTPEDDTRVTLGEYGVYPLEINIENQYGAKATYQTDVSIEPLPTDTVVFVDNFSTGGYSDSDHIPGFWSRTEPAVTGLSQFLNDTTEGRYKWWIESTGNQSSTLRSQNQSMFDFSRRKLVLRLNDLDFFVPTSYPGPWVSWRAGIGFSSTPGQRIDQKAANSLHMVLLFSEGSYTVDLYDGESSLGSFKISGPLLESRHNETAIPCNIQLEVGPSEAMLTVELTDGTERVISGAHSFNPQDNPWITAPSLNMYLHNGSSLARGSQMGLSMDSLMVTSPKIATLLLVR